MHRGELYLHRSVCTPCAWFVRKHVRILQTIKQASVRCGSLGIPLGTVLPQQQSQRLVNTTKTWRRYTRLGAAQGRRQRDAPSRVTCLIDRTHPLPPAASGCQSAGSACHLQPSPVTPNTPSVVCSSQPFISTESERGRKCIKNEGAQMSHVSNV